MFKHFALSNLILLVVVIVCSPKLQAQSDGYQPVFESSPCLFTVPDGYSPECGFLVVPEDRNNPDDAFVRLHVAIFRTTNPNPSPDPVIYLSGGGGANELLHIDFYLRGVGDAILENRDFIMYNQRGSALNDPALFCGYTDFSWERAALDISQEERDQLTINFWLDCQNELMGQGIQLGAYNSAINAADANDLRIALGYEQANFYGTSYGTRLGLALMRDYPEGIRSMILDAVYPPHINYYSEYAHNADRAFSLVFAACEADTNCNRRYPNLDATFYQIVDELNANPRRLTVNGQTVFVDGNFFMELIYAHLYSPQSILNIPYVITRASYGNFEDLRPYIAGTLDASFINLAVWYSMVCQEETPFDSYENALEAGRDLPPQIQAYYVNSFAGFHFRLCESWQVDPMSALENEAVVSDVPTLILSGQYDPITPPSWGQSTSETLSNSFFYEFEGLAHGIMRSDACGLEIGLQFIDDPHTEPDTACMESLHQPEFR